MIDTEGTRKRILEMAIRGKLSDNRKYGPLPSSFFKTIENIRQEKLRKKETKICERTEMIVDGIFDIPETWKWVPLGDLCILLTRGKSPKYSEEKSIPVFAQKCNQPNHLALEKALFLDTDTLVKWPEYLRLRNGDIVINSTGTGTMGRVGFFNDRVIKELYPFMVPDSHITVVRTAAIVFSKYIFYALRSDSIQSIMAKQFRGSTNQKELYINSVYAIPIPLPPYEEQRVIAELIDNSFSIINRIDRAQDSYYADQEVLKNKIIDAGIQGKLTDHLPEDGNAEDLYAQIQEEKEKLITEGKIRKAKPLPLITEEDITFSIPENWKWVRLGSITTTSTGGTPSKTHPEYYGGEYPFFKPSDLDAGLHITAASEYLTDEGRRASRQFIKGSILVCCIGSIGKSAIIDVDGTANQQINVIRPILCDNDYLLYAVRNISFIDQLNKASRATTISIINKSAFDNCILPLPPFAEQKRIVDLINNVQAIAQ